MIKINWYNYDGESFQRFCNDLLSFEFGKGLVPFSAPGQDQGIDGLFEGEYQGKKGRYRFQAKFRSPESGSGRQSQIAELKRSVISDLKTNIQNEDHVIFLTNVEISPKKRSDILLKAKETIESIGSKVTFDIWDGAKIETVLIHHPLLRMWYLFDAKHVLVDWKEYFSTELDPNSTTFYSHSHKFYHREESLAELEVFITSKKENIAIVSGEAGIGKTRLCLEYFSSRLNSKKWTPLVLIKQPLNLDVITKALSGTNKYVLFVDDADDLDERDLSGLIQIIEGTAKHRVKLILSVRNYNSESLFRKIPIHHTPQVKRIKLTQFLKEEASEIFHSEFANTPFEDHIFSLANMSYGVPLMIFTIIRAIKENTQLSDIPEDRFLREYVSRLTEKLSQLATKKIDTSDYEFKKVLSVISLLEPVFADDSSLFDNISEHESISRDKIQLIVDLLKKEGLFTSKQTISIKPDLFSDIILEFALQDSKWLPAKIEQYESQAQNIVKNIGSLSSISIENGVVEKVFNEFMFKIRSCTNRYELEKILSVASTLRYAKPELAKFALDEYFSIFENPKHSLYEQFRNEDRIEFTAASLVSDSVRTIIIGLSENATYLEYSLHFAFRLNLYLNDKQLASELSKFKFSDRFNGFSAVKQNKILNLLQTSKSFKKNSSHSDQFELSLLRNMLKIEYTDFSSASADGSSISIRNFRLPDRPSVRKLRLAVVERITNLAKSKTNISRVDYIQALLGVPRELMSNRSGDWKKIDELSVLLDSIESIATECQLELLEKKEIKDELTWFREWGIDVSLHPKLDDILGIISTNDLAERLVDLLNPRYLGSIEKEQELILKEFKVIVKNSPIETLANALVDAVKQSKYYPQQLHQLLMEIGRIQKNSELFIRHLLKHDFSFFCTHCSNVLWDLRFKHKALESYWSFVNQIEDVKTTEARNLLLTIYMVRPISELLKQKQGNVLLKRDIDFIDYMISSSDDGNQYMLASVVPVYFLIDSKRAIDEILKYMASCSEKQLDTLFMSLNEFLPTNYDELKEILIKGTVRFNLPYFSKRLIDKIVEIESPKVIFDYLISRFKYRYAEGEIKNNSFGYKISPTGLFNSHDTTINSKKLAEVFEMSLIWFVSLDVNSMATFFGKEVLEFSAQKAMSEDIGSIYLRILQTDLIHSELMALIDSLRVFEDKNQEFMGILLKVLSLLSLEKFEPNSELLWRCGQAFTEVGVKSGKVGSPFPSDLKLKSLIESTLELKGDHNILTISFFGDQLKIIEADIAHSSRERDSGW